MRRRNGDSATAYRDPAQRGAVGPIFHTGDTRAVICAQQRQRNGFIEAAARIVNAVHDHQIACRRQRDSDLPVRRHRHDGNKPRAANRRAVENAHLGTLDEGGIVECTLQRDRATRHAVALHFDIKQRFGREPVEADANIGVGQLDIGLPHAVHDGAVCIDRLTVDGKDETGVVAQGRDVGSGVGTCRHRHHGGCVRLLAIGWQYAARQHETSLVNLRQRRPGREPERCDGNAAQQALVRRGGANGGHVRSPHCNCFTLRSITRR